MNIRSKAEYLMSLHERLFEVR